MYEGKRLESLVDRGLKGCFDAEDLEKVVEVALRCTQSSPNLRPKMWEVMKILEAITGQSSGAGNQDESPGGSSHQFEGKSFSFSRNFSGVHDESSFVIEAIELSGPR